MPTSPALDRSSTVDLPLVSVVVPVHQGAATLRRCCEALGASSLPRERWELIVVLDSCSDDSMAIAAEFADSVVRLAGGPYGAAYARNRGAELSRAAAVAFVSADVVVWPDTLGDLVDTLERGSASAVCVPAASSADASPVARYDVERERFLVSGADGEVDAFAARCAAVDRVALVEAGLFDEWRVRTPRTESLEFARRLRGRGHAIETCRGMSAVLHHRHASLWTLLRDAWRDPGGVLSEDTGESRSERCTTSGARRRRLLSSALAWASVGMACWSIAFGNSSTVLAAAATLTALVLADASLLRHVCRGAPAWHALLLVPLHLAVVLVQGAGRVAWSVMTHLVGESRPPAHIEAWAEVGASRWPPVPNRRPAAARASTAPP